MFKLTAVLLSLCLLAGCTGCARIHRHPTLLKAGMAAIGGVTGIVIERETAVNCTHYPPGENGVNAHCPKYPGK